MGIYLNPDNDAFRNFVNTGRYVDKTLLIEKLNLLLNDPGRDFVCVSRPRRFGKSLAENMISAYYSKGADSKELFAPFKISKKKTFATYLNKFNVIKIDLYAMFSEWNALSKSDKNEEKEAIEQVKYVLNPVNQMIDLWRYKYEDNLLLNLSLHPLQDRIKDIPLLCYSLENQVIMSDWLKMLL